MSNLKKLTQLWYKKLKKSGFEDIEDTNSSKEFLKRWDSHYFAIRAKDVTAYQAKEAYYRNALHWVESHNFDTLLEKRVWAAYADGMPVTHIAQAMRRLGHKQATNFKINKIMKKLLELFNV